MSKWLILVFLFWSVGCQKKPKTFKAYAKYISDPSNGFIKSRNAGPFIFSLKYLPPEYRTLQEVPSMEHPVYDSLLTIHSTSLHFIFKIEPNPDKAVGDVTYSSIQSIEQYDDRLRTLNFGMKDYWTLSTSQGTYPAALTNLENTYGLTDYRNIYLVFVDPDSSTHLFERMPWTITFRDEIWGAGVNRWRWE